MNLQLKLHVTGVYSVNSSKLIGRRNILWQYAKDFSRLGGSIRDRKSLFCHFSRELGEIFNVYKKYQNCSEKVF